MTKIMMMHPIKVPTKVIGPRQVGKTTLVRDLFGDGRFVTLDNSAVLAAIDADPEGQLTDLLDDVDSAPPNH